jgi:chromosome partitioning protein
LLGFVINQRDSRLSVHNAIEGVLRRVHGDSVFHAVLPDAAAFKAASVARLPIHRSAPRSPAAKAIAAVFEEMLSRIEQAGQTKRKEAA